MTWNLPKFAILMTSCGLVVACAAEEAKEQAPSESSDTVAADAQGADTNPTTLDGTSLEDTVKPAGDGETEGGNTPDSELGDADMEDGGEAINPSDEAYVAGGLLGVYTTLEEPPEESEIIIEPLLFKRVDERIDFPSIDPTFSVLAAIGLLHVEWTGGFHAEVSGEYTFKVTAADSIRVQLGEETLFDSWDTQTYTTLEETITLEAGWHPLEIAYENMPDASLVVLSAKVPGGWMETIPTSLLGTQKDTPEEEPSLTVPELSVQEVWAHGASLSLSTSAPTKITAKWTSFDSVKGEVPGLVSQFHTEHSVTLVLSPGSSYDVVIHIEDLWGREVATVPIPIQTPDPGDFIQGGLYGSYYDGANFNELILHRLDPQINLPQDADGNPNGSFATPMGGNTFSIRWTGAIDVPETSTYTLYVGSNDGHRFFLDEEMLFEDWENQDLTYSQVTMELAEGWHSIQLEYYEATGQAAVALEWENEELGIERMPIPQENLGNSYSFADDQANPVLSDFTGQANNATTASFQWKASELCTALLYYRVEEPTTLEIVTPEISIPFDVPATGWQWTIPEIEDGGLLKARVVVKDLLQNSDSSEEIKFEIEGEMDN